MTCNLCSQNHDVMRYADLSDEQLVARCAAGDRSALAAIYDRYATLVFSLVVRILGEGMAAEEATQDTFMALGRRAGDYSAERGRLLSWLLTIARNRAIDELRRGRTRADAVEWSNAGPNQPGLEDTSLPRVYVRRALALLPGAQREVLELAYYGGMTQQEIAEYLSVPLGTVKTRMRLGLQRLRTALDELAPAADVETKSAVHPTNDSPT